MFTGIVESSGCVKALRPESSGTARLVIVTGGNFDLASVPVGGSVAVNGACLTLMARGEANGENGGEARFDLGPETLARTTLGGLCPGNHVHLERPLRAGDPLGGHLVSGHVDGVGVVASVTRQGAALELRIDAPVDLARFLAPKGSVTVDGVSLTINAATGGTFDVMLIPHTLAISTLGERKAGDRVNIEADLIAKHIAHLMAHHATP